MSIHHSNWVSLPVQPAMPAPLPSPPGNPQMPRQPVPQERGQRQAPQSGQAGRGTASTHSSAAISREAQQSAARGDLVDAGDHNGQPLDLGDGGGAATAATLGRIEGRSAPSREEGRDNKSGLSGEKSRTADSEDVVRPNDVVGLFSSPGRHADEDLVKQIVKEQEVVRANRLKRKFEVILTMARAGMKQDLAQMAICEEAMRHVDMQFDELDRGLQLRLREAKQAVASRKVRSGPAATYDFIAADQHDRRQLRKRLEEMRHTLRQSIIAASTANGALNATALIGLLQALQDQVECELVALEENLPTNSARVGAEQIKEIDARRAKALQMIGDAWRRAGETQSGLTAMFSEVRRGVEQRFEHQREQVLDV